MELKCEESTRLDAFLAAHCDKSRSQIVKCIKNGDVKVNGIICSKPSYTLKPGETVVFQETKEERPAIAIPKEMVEIEYVYKDKDIAIINKPRGMVVHPAPGHHDDTLVNYLMAGNENFDFDKEDKMNDRPGIVHRIDKDTQGLLAVAMNEESQLLLQNEIQDREFHRYYLALVWGNVKDKRFKIDAPLTRPNHTEKRAKVDVHNGREAITHCVLLGTTGKVSLLKCILETGRTHQIRAHLAYIGYPIVGDPLYGKREAKEANKGQALSAYELTLIHPTTQKTMTFYTPIDEYFKKLLRIYFR